MVFDPPCPPATIHVYLKSSMASPAVSIGLPVYNGENYVGQAIASVLAQSWQDFELIISDNASTDQTESICVAFAKADARIRYYRGDVNRGAAWNFNRVFHLSTGNYFRWLSHDDVLGTEALAQCVDHLESHSEVVLCANSTGVIDSSGYRVFDAGGDSELAFQGLTEAREKRRVDLSRSASPVDRYRGILLNSFRCYEVYGLIRRQVMAQTQLHPSYCGGEKVLLAELALQGKFSELSDVQFFCRWHDERFTANDSSAEQTEHMTPGKKAWGVLPHQYRATLGYLQLLASQRLSFAERLRLAGVWLQFTLQYRKWFSILRNTLSGRATAVTLDRPTERGEKLEFQEFASKCIEPVDGENAADSLPQLDNSALSPVRPD